MACAPLLTVRGRTTTRVTVGGWTVGAIRAVIGGIDVVVGVGINVHVGSGVLLDVGRGATTITGRGRTVGVSCRTIRPPSPRGTLLRRLTPATHAIGVAEAVEATARDGRVVAEPLET